LGPKYLIISAISPFFEIIAFCIMLIINDLKVISLGLGLFFCFAYVRKVFKVSFFHCIRYM